MSLLVYVLCFVGAVIENGRDINACIAATTEDTPVAIIGDSICPKAMEFKTTERPQSK